MATKKASKQPTLRVLRGKLTPAAHVRYLNVATLKRTKKAIVDIGSVKVGGHVIPLAAEVRQGQIVAIRPVHCEGCKSDGRAGAMGAAKKAAIKAELRRFQESKKPGLRLPIPVSRLIGRPISVGLDFFCYFWDCCIVITYTDGWSCSYCIRGPGLCIGPVVIEN